MIDNFYPSLSVCVAFIGGCLAAGWALSREVADIQANYRDKVDSFRALAKAQFATELWSLHGYMKKAQATAKKRFTMKDLMDDVYVDRVTALSGLVEMETAASDFYESMWKACSSGSNYMLTGAILLLPIPFLLFFYSPNFLGSFEIIGFLFVLFAAGFVYQAGLRVRSYFRNRDRLLDLLGTDTTRQAKLPEFGEE